MTALLMLGWLAAASPTQPEAKAPAADEASALNEGTRAAYRDFFEDLEAWDLEAATADAEQLKKQGVPEEVAQEIDGRLAFFTGDYARAVANLGGTQSELASLAVATQKETDGYAHRESEHFSLAFPAGKDELLAPYALETLELARTRIGEDLGELPKEKIRVEILRDPTALSRMSPLTEAEIRNSGTIALCKYNKLMVVSPRAMVLGYTWRDTLAHELTHYLITRKSHNQTPIWIHEGIAKYEESRWRTGAGEGLTPAAAALLSRRLNAGTLITYAQMHPSIALLKQDDAALAFAEVFTTIEFLLKERHGSLDRLLAELGRGTEDEKAVALVAGEPFDRFAKDWKAYLRRRPMPKEFLPLAPQRLRFKESGNADAPPTDELEAEIDDPNARGFAHLGELLLTRSRHAAALVELGKAEARVGARSPALSNLYARALLAADQRPEAERVLRASVVPFPDVAQTHLRLAEIQLLARKWPEAGAELAAANGIDPFDPVIHAGLLKVAEETKDAPGEALEKQSLEILKKQ